MTTFRFITLTSRALGATALTLVATTAMPQSKPVQENAGTVAAPPSAGFSIRVNGEVLTEDGGVENVARQVDVALDQADVQIVFDGLGGEPRLDMEIAGPTESHEPGDLVTLQSALNYPAYIDRAEFRIIDRAAIGGPRTVATVPVTANGVATVTLPAGEDLVVVHRVYDQTGRFDETEPLTFADSDRRANSDGVEEGTDLTARRRIPIYGGAVTVRGTGVTPGAQVTALGEQITPDPAGGFVLQRILPSGDYDVDVAVKGFGQNVDQTRRVSIPASEWFTTGTVDLTYRQRDGEDTQTGRVAAYVDGRTENGVEVTASIDTQEGDLDEIFRDLDEKDPRQLLLRVDPSDLYPTYGDDSELVDNTPTSGKIYVRVAREGNLLLWGDFESQLGGNSLVRNERTLYGLQAHAETPSATTSGEARASLDLYAAQPDRLPQRDEFRGTGGSVYFLDKQDIGSGSETVTIQLRDPTTDRVIETRTLDPGADYDINYIQGIVTLAAPLQSTIDQTTVVTDPTAAAEVRLVVQYEFTPSATDVDGYATGGRVEGWVTDELRLGLSGIQEQTGFADQTLIGADLRYQISETSYLQIDVAESDGPGFGSTFSNDGGLVIDTVEGGSGTGQALKVEGKLGFGDIGLATEGAASIYFEDRTEGFASLDTTVTAATGDETLWGFAIDAQPQDGLRFGAYYDNYENQVGEHDRTGGVEVGYALNAQTTLDVGIEHVDRARGTDFGERTDVAARLTYAVSDKKEVYGFGQATINRDQLEENNRLGIGGATAFDNGWTLEGEVSDGSLGIGARVLARRADGEGNEVYAGYELEPGRDLNGLTLNGHDRGRFVTGGKRRLGSDVTVFGENTYDMFGRRESLTSAYGLAYTASDALRYSGALEVGVIDDGDADDFDRTAVSFGVEYEDDRLLASGRLEYRVEDGTRSGAPLESETILLATDARYKLSDSARIVASFDHAETRTDESAILDGVYTDVTLGYAFRPVDHDRLNMLARYRYLNDQVGQRVDSVDEDGPRQRSQVLSVDALYDLNREWSIGGKLGYRSTESAATEGDDFTQNDAWLAAANVTYHLVHEWDALLEVRSLNTVQAETSDFGVLAAAYRHFGNNVKLGVGYNFSEFSDDLTDLVIDDSGLFINLVAKF
ncbi:MAG: hypothetical protein AAFQ64_00250 [Pseudomonadota bacterium]